jgi:hypothetical protein
MALSPSTPLGVWHGLCCAGWVGVELACCAPRTVSSVFGSAGCCFDATSNFDFPIDPISTVAAARA